MEKSRVKTRNKANLWLVIALCIVSAALITTTILWITNMNQNREMGSNIESVYQRNFYDLVDNVNNAEVKLSKVLASNQDSYCKKMLSEISKNANSASYNLSNLPISLGGVDETKKFINQVSGYADSLAEKMDKGNSLTQAEIDTLSDIYDSMSTLKDNLAQFSDKVLKEGYNIFKNGNLIHGDINGFTQKIQGIKSSDTEYPTMIYDGPFSDSEYNKQIKGLPKELVSVEHAKNVVKGLYQNISDEDIKYLEETKGKFNTFNFEVNLNNINLYVQVTKNGGKILTISGYGDTKDRKISLNDAISKAKNVANKETKTTFDCVWSDIVGNDAYINLAPVQSGVILYPDLIKVKVDLSSGEIMGYSASSFYTNHTARTLSSITYEKAQADAQIPSGYNVEMSRICLAPLDYGTEKLCYEYKCLKNDITYYIYINAQTGVTENILRVVETADGNKLM